jgi:hypothetical protein
MVPIGQLTYKMLGLTKQYSAVDGNTLVVFKEKSIPNIGLTMLVQKNHRHDRN